MLTLATGAHGTLQLLIDRDSTSGAMRRAVRLETSEDGKSLVLIDVDERKPGIHREIRHEITPAELIAVIRATGAELPGENYLAARVA